MIAHLAGSRVSALVFLSGKMIISTFFMLTLSRVGCWNTGASSSSLVMLMSLDIPGHWRDLLLEDNLVRGSCKTIGGPEYHCDCISTCHLLSVGEIKRYRSALINSVHFLCSYAALGVRSAAWGWASSPRINKCFRRLHLIILLFGFLIAV